MGPIIELVPDADINDENKNIRKGIGYLDYYLEHDRRFNYLDSAIFYLQNDKETLKKSSVGNYSLGEIYIEMNNVNSSIDAYKNAVKINPEFANALFKVGKAYTILGDHNSGDKFFQKGT